MHEIVGKVEIVSEERYIGCVLIIQQKFWKFELFYCVQLKNWNFLNFCWMIKTKPISPLKLFLLYIGIWRSKCSLHLCLLSKNNHFQTVQQSGETGRRRSLNSWHFDWEKLVGFLHWTIKYTKTKNWHCSKIAKDPNKKTENTNSRGWNLLQQK